MKRQGRNLRNLFGVILAVMLSWSIACPLSFAFVQKFESLRLSPAPTSPKPSGRSQGPECIQHGPGTSSAKRSIEKREPAPQESEHRPVPVRAYQLSELRRLAQVNAFVRRPDGSVIEPDLHLGVNPGLSFQTPLGKNRPHGAHNVYVVEQGVEEGALVIRSAKWITMHHNCGWGHDQKFNDKLTQPQALKSIPFEIVIADLWDRNFHSRISSGQELGITVLCNGKPAPNAHVTITSENGWSKEVTTEADGTAAVQLIGDYYPLSWQDFNRSRRGEFLVTAEYEVSENGTFKEASYDRVCYISTHPWNYTPAGSDYSSYSVGLLIMTGFMVLSSFGVYLYRERRKKPYERITFDE